MQEGFLVYRNGIYYGLYDERQVSGKMRISCVKPENIKTNRKAEGEDWAVRFYDNHRLLEPEYEALQTMLVKMKTFMELNTEQAVDFSYVEERLNISLPDELKSVYVAISNQDEYFSGAEHFLSLDEIYVEQGVIVFFKKKRTPIAGYDIETGALARYSKKQWMVDRGDTCCYQFCISRILTIALENKAVVRQGRCKGRLVKTLNIERELEKDCQGKYQFLTELGMYGIAVMYSEDGMIAWIRSNGFYTDIHAGADTESQLDDFGQYLEEVEWK